MSTRYDFVRAPSKNGRVYYTNAVGRAVHTDENLCVNGGIPSEYPSTTFSMGVERPTAALSVGLSQYDAGFPYGEIIGTVSYVYTIVRKIDAEYSEESAPSPPSFPVPIRGNEQATLTGFVADSIDAALVVWRVYRSLGGKEYEAVPTGRDGNGDFVFDMPGAETEFTDLDVQTQKIYMNVNILCETMGWDVLPYGAANLCRFQNGILAATFEKKVLLSVLFVPYAFPQGISTATMDYTYEFPTEPSRIASFRDMLIVGLGSNPYVLMGSDPSNMQMQELSFNQACIGDMCVTEVGVFYPSPDGLVLCDGVTALPVTENTYTIEQWTALQPDKLKMFYHNNKLIGFFKGTSGGFVFDFKGDKTVVETYLGDGVLFVAGHMVPEEDKLYLLIDNDPWPRIVSAVIDETGAVLTIVFNKDLYPGAAYVNADFNLDASVGGTDVGLTCVSGAGTDTWVLTIAKVIRKDEIADLDYLGRTDGIEDADGNDLAAVHGVVVINNSEEDFSDLIFWDGFEGTISGTTYEATNYDYPAFHSGVVENSTITVTPSYRVVGDKCIYFNNSSVNAYLGFGPMSTVRGRVGLWWRPVGLLTGRPIVTLTGDVSSYKWSLGIQVGATADVVTIKGRCNGTEWLSVGYSITLPYALVLMTAYFIELSWDYETGVFNIFIDGELVGTITKISTLVGTFTHVFPGGSFLIPTAPNMAADNLIISTDPNRDLYAISLLEAYPGV